MRAAQSKCTWTFHIVREFAGKMPQTKSATHTLRELAQSKCTWMCHKSHFAREFTCKMPQTKSATHTLRELVQRNALGPHKRYKSYFVREFTCKMPQTSWSSLIKHRPLHLPQEPVSVDTIFGEQKHQIITLARTVLVAEICRWKF